MGVESGDERIEADIHEATLYVTGSTTRAVEPGHAVYKSVAAETRREFRAAAFRGSFAPGETINFNAAAIPLDLGSLRTSRGRLFLRADKVLVRWNATAADAAAIGLGAYLAERASLLIDPSTET